MLAVAKTKATKTKPKRGRFTVRVTDWRSGDPDAAGVGIVDVDESGQVTIVQA